MTPSHLRQGERGWKVPAWFLIPAFGWGMVFGGAIAGWLG